MPFTKTYPNPTGIPQKWVLIYSRRKAAAKHNRQEWAYTLESFYEQWKASGVMEHYGPKPHHYTIVRKDPIEAWGPHNCIIVSNRTRLRKQCYEKMLKMSPSRDWRDTDDVRYTKK